MPKHPVSPKGVLQSLKKQLILSNACKLLILSKTYRLTVYEIHDYTLFHLYLAVVLSNKKEDSVNNKLFMKTCLKSHFVKHK